MIKDKKTTVGYHCPFCGSSILNRVNIFSMSNKLLKLKCPCGESELAMQIMKDNRIRLTVPCIICPVTHSFTLSSDTFFRKDLFYLTCTFTAIGICFFGRSDKVINAMKENEEELIKMFSAYDDEYDPEDYVYRNGFSTVRGGEHDDDEYEEEYEEDDDFEMDEFLENFDFFLNDDDDDNDDDGEKNYISEIRALYKSGGDSGGKESNEEADCYDAIINNIIGVDGAKNVRKGNASNKNQRKFEIYKNGSAAGNTEVVSEKKEDTTIDANEKILIDKFKIKSPVIFEKILNILYSFINEKKIHCLCGDQDKFDGEMTIKEDKIILKCKICGANRAIKAASPADLEYFYDIDELYLD